MQDPAMGSKDKGIGLEEPGLIDFLGERHPVPAQGDGIHLSTRGNLNGHWLHTILGGELEPGIERNLTVRHSLSQQGTFRLSQGFYTFCWDYLVAVLGVLEGGMSVTKVGQVDGETWWEVLQDWLWLGCGGMTACWGTGWCNVLCICACYSWVIRHVWDFLHLWSFYHHIGDC